jgi:twitching motility protein PilT
MDRKIFAMAEYDSLKMKPGGKARLGERLMAGGLIDENQLEQVLQRQSQSGGRVGSLMIEMGLVQVDDLLCYLGNRYGLPAENLFKQTIGEETLRIIPLHQITEKMILPLSVDQHTIKLGMANPQDFDTVSEIEFQLNRKIKPVIIPLFMFEAAVRYLQTNGVCDLNGEILAEMVALKKGGDGLPSLSSLLNYLVQSKASDMLICVGTPPSLKIGNALKRLPLAALSPGDCEKYARDAMPAEAWENFFRRRDYGFSASFDGIGRFRISAFWQRNSVAIAVRPIQYDVPSLAALNLPSWIKDYALRPCGLILISGPAGHGKSTTLAAMVDIINTHRGCNIITLEDPIEYLHKHKKSNVIQREIGTDTPSFLEGMRHEFRQAPDVLVVGELRDKETFRIALQAANSGHLVLTTTHSENSTVIIERTINMFEPHEQSLIRMMLSESLVLSLAQRLVLAPDGKHRVLALEKFQNSHRLRKFIREGKTHQIRAQLQSGAEDFVSIDVTLAELCKAGKIASEEALNHADDRQFLRDLIELPAKK